MERVDERDIDRTGGYVTRVDYNCTDRLRKIVNVINTSMVSRSPSVHEDSSIELAPSPLSNTSGKHREFLVLTDVVTCRKGLQWQDSWGPLASSFDGREPGYPTFRHVFDVPPEDRKRYKEALKSLQTTKYWRS